jgi:succinyl-diaminopimelate desuccinylase
MSVPVSPETKAIVDETIEMMLFRTSNPPGDELALASWLAARASSFGMDAVVQDVSPGRGNCIAVAEFGPGPTIVLCTHLDVVPALREETWTPRVQAGRLHGRGACDAKGPLAAMLAACRRLMANPTLTGRLVLAAVADEETDATGALHLVQDFEADAVIIGEPTSNRPVLSSRGALRLAVDFDGVSSHSSTPHRGRNAVHSAARFVVAGERYHARLLQDGRWASHAATVIQGGTKLNMVPDGCRVLVDRRLDPGETLSEAEAEIHQILEGLRLEDPELTWTVSEAGVWLAPFTISETSDFAVRILRAVGQLEAGPAFPGGTDAPHFISKGIPAVILGPGELEQAHSDDEWVELDQLSAAVDLYEACALSFLDPATQPPFAKDEVLT